MEFNLTILGSGNSTGVPDLGLGYKNCNPNNPKNTRLRTSLYLNFNVNNVSTKILIDCSPDFKQQALKNNITKIDYLLLTHEHADHIYGINELRSINKLNNQSIPTICTSITLKALKKAFYYIFSIKNNSQFVVPSLTFKLIKPKQKTIKINNISTQITRQQHGNMQTIGFIFNKTIGYIPDFSSITEEEIIKYTNIPILIIACTTTSQTFLHASFSQVLEIIKRINPQQAVLVHMGVTLDYEEVNKQVAKNTIAGFDNMQIIGTAQNNKINFKIV